MFLQNAVQLGHFNTAEKKDQLVKILSIFTNYRFKFPLPHQLQIFLKPKSPIYKKIGLFEFYNSKNLIP